MFRTGWCKDKVDERDRIHVTAKVVPDVVDLSANLPDVRDQGNLGSCTGFGIGGNLTGTAIQSGVYATMNVKEARALRAKIESEELSADGAVNFNQENEYTAAVTPEWFSPKWIYNGGRLLEGSLDEDSGCEPRDNLEFVRKYGCLLEHFAPYVDKLDTTDPTKWSSAPEALKWPIVSYTRLVDGVDGVCSGLASGSFVSIGSPWYESWMDTDGEGTLEERYDWVAGGHETFLYGYDKTTGFFMGQNSWGSSWGLGGRYKMPFSAINAFKQDGGYDAHLVTVDWSGVEPPPPPPPNPKPCSMRLMYRILTGGHDYQA